MALPYSVPNLKNVIREGGDANLNNINVDKITFPDGTNQTTSTHTQIENGTSYVSIDEPNASINMYTTDSPALSILTNQRTKLHGHLQFSDDTTLNSSDNLVDKSQDQSIDGIKTFNSDIKTAQIKAKDSNGLKLYNDAGNKGLFVSDGGNVGIGTTSPNAPLTIMGGSGYISALNNSVYFTNTTNDSNWGGTGWAHVYRHTSKSWSNIGIYSEKAIATKNYIVSTAGTLSASDERIKKNIEDIDDDECLQKVRQLKPKKYKYKDEFKRGSNYVYGFLAQDVSNVIKEGVGLRTWEIPSIYQMGDVSNNIIHFDNNYNVSDILTTDSNVLHLINENDKTFDMSYTSIDISSNSIIMESNVSDKSDVNKMFVYGHKIDDFQFLNKDAIWTITTSAVQEIDRQQQADKLKIAELEQRLTALEGN